MLCAAKTQKHDILTYTAKTQSEYRDAEFLYLHDQYQLSLQDIPQEFIPHDTNYINKNSMTQLNTAFLRMSWQTNASYMK